MTRLDQQMNFIREVDGIKNIGRQTYLSDASRKENDAEHSWHLALMAIILQEHANETLDVLRVVSMVLIHDIVELDAGDTYAYDTAGNETKKEREEAAADRIFHLLPEDQAAYFLELWNEFEAQETPEACFANTLDKVQPTMLNDASGAKSWEEHHVRLSQILERNQRTGEGSHTLWDYSRNHFIEPNVASGAITNDI